MKNTAVFKKHIEFYTDSWFATPTWKNSIPFPDASSATLFSSSKLCLFLRLSKCWKSCLIVRQNHGISVISHYFSEKLSSVSISHFSPHSLILLSIHGQKLIQVVFPLTYSNVYDTSQEKPHQFSQGENCFLLRWFFTYLTYTNTEKSFWLFFGDEFVDTNWPVNVSSLSIIYLDINCQVRIVWL